jgi:uncharacterized membrane protein
MFKLTRSFLRNYRQLAVIASLLLATGLCVTMLGLRLARADNFEYIGLFWNLFLAWLPAVSALTAYNLQKQRSRMGWILIAGCALIWLLFFPNAPYLLTDLIHLRPLGGAPLWYDLILVIAFAWTGSFLGLISLLLMQSIVRKMAGALASWIFALGVLSVSGFEIYLGRFLRWNSWDVFVHPISILLDVIERLRHPLANFQTYVFSILFSLFFICAYLMLVSVTQFQGELLVNEPSAPSKS